MIYDYLSSTRLLAISKNLKFIFFSTLSVFCLFFHTHGKKLSSTAQLFLHCLYTLHFHHIIGQLIVPLSSHLLSYSSHKENCQAHNNTPHKFSQPPIHNLFFCLLLITLITPAFMFVHTEHQHFSATLVTSIRGSAFLHQLKRDQAPATLKNAAVSESLHENNFRSMKKARRRLN